MTTSQQLDQFVTRNHCLVYTNVLNHPAAEPSVLDLIRNRVVLARWVTEFDAKQELPFWYIIKDEPTHLEKLTKKRQRNIRIAESRMEVHQIDRKTMLEKGYSIFYEANKGYHSSHIISEAEYKNDLMAHSDLYNYWGAFWGETGEMVAYWVIHDMQTYCNVSAEKIHPEFKKYNVSLYGHHVVDNYYLNVKKVKFVSAGVRSLFHDTNVQHFLMDKCGFRKAYCRTKIKFMPFVPTLTRLLNLFEFATSKSRRLSTILNSLNYHLMLKKMEKSFNFIFVMHRHELDPASIRPVPEGFDIVVFQPTFRRLALHDLDLRSRIWLLLMLVTLRTRKRMFKAYYLFDGDRVAHYSYAHERNFRFAYLGRQDISIGPCWTDPAYRGRGLYAAMLDHILATNTDIQDCYISIHEKNAASLRGLEKSRFTLHSIGVTSPVLRIFQSIYPFIADSSPAES